VTITIFKCDNCGAGFTCTYCAEGERACRLCPKCWAKDVVEEES
jgi:hypothetical protein